MYSCVCVYIYIYISDFIRVSKRIIRVYFYIYIYIYIYNICRPCFGAQKLRYRLSLRPRLLHADFAARVYQFLGLFSWVFLVVAESFNSKDTKDTQRPPSCLALLGLFAWCFVLVESLIPLQCVPKPSKRHQGHTRHTARRPACPCPGPPLACFRGVLVLVESVHSTPMHAQPLQETPKTHKTHRPPSPALALPWLVFMVFWW